jgi:2-keto-3-deoxy-6-phosphogluconate aldolase
MATIEVEEEASNGTSSTVKTEEASLDLGAVVGEHPVAALAAALGVGYVLGGGLFTTLTSRLMRSALRLGVQLALLPAFERELADAAGRLGTKLKGGATTPAEHDRH